MPTHDGWEHILLAAGYEFATFDGINRFYVDQQHQGLIPALAYPISALDRFVTTSAHELEVRARELERGAHDVEVRAEQRVRHMRGELARVGGELSEKSSELEQLSHELETTRAEFADSGASWTRSTDHLHGARVGLSRSPGDRRKKRPADSGGTRLLHRDVALTRHARTRPLSRGASPGTSRATAHEHARSALPRR